MSERVTMPALGESVTEGTVTRWLKQVGEEVAVDEPLLEVSTDKVDTEIPSPVAGTLQEILVQEDETVEVGADLAVVGEGAGGDSAGSGSDAASSEPARSEEPAQSEEPAPAEPSAAAEPDEKNTEDEAPAQAAPAQASNDAGGAGGSGEGETVTMPALGESVTEGTITRWLKAEGDEVAMDEPLLEVSTDKVDTEVPSPAAGTLTKILVQEDETVEVGAKLAVIGGAPSGGDAASSSPAASTGSSVPAPTKDTETTKSEPQAEQKDEAPAPEPEKKAEPAPESEPAPQKPEPSAAPAAQPSASSEGDGGSSAYVTPLVRKLATQHDVDLASVKGTGIGGRIRKQDVLEAAEAAKAPATPEAPAAPAAASTPAAPSIDVSAKRGTTEKMTRMRRLIATRMVESLQVSAQLTTVVEVDVTRIARLRDRAKAGFAEREGVKLSFLPFFALAAVEALKTHPVLNASVEDDSIVYHSSENLGIAVDTEKGLFVPVIQNAGDLNIAGLARKIGDLAARTRDNKVTPDELGGGTFTLTNTGSRGALFDTPIINQPQVAILGTGSVVKRAVVLSDADGGETIAIRSMVYLALSYDHRIVDGADAARFLGTVKERLEEGAFEV
ncbi:2-oxoglutarate dehydrogenase, E2 component, dihydrolipoamide succinyltransferase [Allobranchiibius huperziae]|uniref:Dihydrolipoamide acetyltransferase component of pyruvate dehydrogenase complex n=1 Tax=Allobranchiibius huperziae TaxID=1874116 RepID=A0A853DBX4_9MICO|nr:2-oxoglutarate dehydrogenase, E2 component, dihydrolipoamide succinyltransferase [Allobranchiibius huperziae]NYJ75076.1 2-oxoglutarate dehydrogenase E2 component (dihydrolipoamide succinyltransferase) [Allobranchiibius huperziae]